ncbi:hypothetical protein L1887_44547 [Cichorium endivia]|nr:hypothetical protein L1887_44547 [Cichorium endivia]
MLADGENRMERKKTSLDRGEGSGLLELGVACLDTGVLGASDGSTAVNLEQLVQVVLGRLEHLDLAHVDVLEGEDALGGLLHLAANHLGDELGDKLAQVARVGLALHNLEHLLADGADVRRLGVRVLLDLVGALLGEGDHKDAEQVAVGGLDVLVRLNERLPLAHERAQLVRGEVHAVEVGEAGAALDAVDLQLELAVRLLVVLVEVGERSLDNAALERVIGVLETLRTVDKGLANVAVLEEGRGLDVVPVLAGEGVNSPLLVTLALGELLVLADSCRRQLHT